MAFFGVILYVLTLLFVSSLAQGNNGTSETTNSKNILFYMGCSSYSMRISVWPLVQALADKGHRVTFLSAYESKSPHPGVFDFAPKSLQKWMAETAGEVNFFEARKSRNLLLLWFFTYKLGVNACKIIYDDPETSKWVRSSNFDLVFVDSLFNDCAFGMAYGFRAKTIILSTTTLVPWLYDALGIPDDSSWAGTDPFVFGEINFLERVINAVMPIYWKFVRETWYYPKLEEITAKGLNVESLPSFSELEKNTSLTFLTTHYSQEFARAFPPNVIPIGGLAITGKLEPLPRDIEEFIAKGKDGFIYISFGTYTEFSAVDNETRQAFVNGLLKFPHIRFIWKAAQGVGMVLPENFMILKWAPQLSLLAHPKIKAFVTHAGLGGINEAIYYGVPMISFPLFAEQDYNAKLLKDKGIGIKLEIVGLQAHELETAIKDILGNSRMKEKMQRVSAFFKNRPQTVLETALWWTEYVLEHESSELSEFLRPHSANQSWWVRRQLDVWITLFTAALFITFLLYNICKLIIQFLVRKLFKRDSERAAGTKKVKQN